MDLDRFGEFKASMRICLSPFHACETIAPNLTAAALPELFCISCFGLKFLNGFEVLSGPAHEDPRAQEQEYFEHLLRNLMHHNCHSLSSRHGDIPGTLTSNIWAPDVLSSLTACYIT